MRAPLLVTLLIHTATAFTPIGSRRPAGHGLRTRGSALLPASVSRAPQPLASAGLPLLADPVADPIAAAFWCVTFVPQPLWLLLVLAPNWGPTRRLFTPLWPIAVLGLAHLVIVATSTGLDESGGTAPIELFNELFNPTADGLAIYGKLSEFRNFAAEEWTHVLIWDLFVGRWIWLDGRRRDIFTSHSVLVTNLIGPPGLLIHFATCLVLGKALPGEDEDA